MTVLCTISLVVMVGNIPFGTTAQVEGRVLSKNSSNYVANFESYIRKEYPKVVSPENYSKYLVAKDKCGELNEQN